MDFQRLTVAAFWLAATFALTMALLPHPPLVPGNPTDKVQHIVAFVILAVLACFAYPRAKRIRIIVALSSFGAMIELLQMIPDLHRSSDWLDWLADTGAVLAAVIFVLTVRNIYYANRTMPKA